MTDPKESGSWPTRQQINQWMMDVGWQNCAIRQADLESVERVVRLALAASPAPVGAPEKVQMPDKARAGIEVLHQAIESLLTTGRYGFMRSTLIAFASAIEAEVLGSAPSEKGNVEC